MKYHGPNPEKLSLPWGEVTCLSLGEAGRGRVLTLVPFDFANNANNYVAERGSNGGIKIVRSNENEATPGIITLLSGEGVYTRNTTGTVYIVPEDRKKIKLLAWGKGAWGDAGNIGTWYQFLVSIEEFPCRFLIRPAGGRAKKDRYWKVFVDENTIRDIGPEVFSIYNEVPLPFGPNEGDVQQLLDLRDLR